MMQGGSLLWLAIGASLFGIVTHASVSPFVWAALVCLLHASRSMPFATGMPMLWLALFAALAIGQRGILPVPGPMYFVLVAAITTTATMPFAVDRLAGTRLGTAGQTLIFPLAWVAVEFLQSRLTPSATWGSLAYTQYGNLPLMQLAALVGLWGITFLITWFASTVDLAWSRGFEWAAVRTPTLIFIAVFAAAVLAGTLRVSLAPSDRPTMRMATLNRPADLFVPGEMTRITEGRLSTDERGRMAGKLEALQASFLDGSRREARAGARLILWPEGNLLVFAQNEPAFLERAQQMAADERVYLAIGMGTIHLDTPLPFENKLVVIDPSGRIAMSYEKSHAVVGWEAGIMRVGSGRVPVIPTPDGRMAGAICYDADFPEFIRQAAQGRADLLILPVNDWKEIKDIHMRMHAFRAIENGMPVIRAAASGISGAFDPWGRVLATADYFAAGDRTMTAQVAVGAIPTLYGRIGDLFAWLCLAALAAALTAAALAPRTQTTTLEAPPIDIVYFA